MKWKPYDAKWLAELVKKQHPDRLKVQENLTGITSCAEESRAYYYFVNPENQNREGSEWQFKENLIVQDERLGDIILDILEDDKVGGVELLRYVK
jgi:hypothetical protein